MKRFKLSERYLDEYCQMTRDILSRYRFEAETEGDLYGCFGPSGIQGLMFEPGHIEFVEDFLPGYHPRSWNEYPITEPPKDVVMFVSLDNKFLTTAVYKGNGVWKSANPDKDEVIEGVQWFKAYHEDSDEF